MYEQEQYSTDKRCDTLSANSQTLDLNCPDAEDQRRDKFLDERTLTAILQIDSDTGDTASQSSLSFKLEDSQQESEYEAGLHIGDKDPPSLSPTCVSQSSSSSKKLEWDSAADVGYQGEGSGLISLTAIERLALGSVSQAFHGSQKARRKIAKALAVVDSSTDEENVRTTLSERRFNTGRISEEADYYGEESITRKFVLPVTQQHSEINNSTVNRVKQLNKCLPKASSLNELRAGNLGQLQRSLSFGGDGKQGHVQHFHRKQTESTAGSSNTIQYHDSPKRVSSETNSDRESVKTQVTVVQESKIPVQQQPQSRPTSSDLDASTSGSSENRLQRRRRRKVKRGGDQALHDVTKSFEYLPGHVYESENASSRSLNSSSDSHRAQAGIQNLVDQIANSDLVEALVIALKQRLELDRPAEPVAEPQPSSSSAPVNPPGNCTLTRPEPSARNEERFRASADTLEEQVQYRHMEMATSSFEYRKVRRSRRQQQEAHEESSESSARDVHLGAEEHQEGYSSGSVFSGGRGSSSLPSYTPTSRHSEVNGDIVQQHTSQGGSLISEIEVRNQLQVCKQLSRHLKGLREYVGQLERTWRALAPPEALTSSNASPVSHNEHHTSYSTPTTLSQSVTLSIAPTPQSEDTTISNVLMHHPPKLVREYASVSIDCHLDRVRTRTASTSRQFVHQGAGSGTIRSAFAKHTDMYNRRGGFSMQTNKVSVGVNTNDPVAKKRDFTQNYPSPIVREPERDGLSVGVQTTPQPITSSLKSSRGSSASRRNSSQISPVRQNPPAEAFFFPLNRNSVIKLRRGSDAIHNRSSSSSRSTSTRTSTRTRRDEKIVPTLQESLQKGRPDFITRSERRQQMLHQAQENRETKSVHRRERLASLASTLGSLESENLPRFSKVNHLAVPKTKMPTLSPISSQQRMFTHKEMRRQTEKMFRRLPEAQQQALERVKSEATRANRLMAQIYQKRLQERALKGQVNLTHDQSILTG